MTTTYTCEGFRPIRQSADGFGEIQRPADAALVFANRLARREYGRRGYARTIRCDSWAADGSSKNYEVFIGVDGDQPGSTVGRNEWLYVNVNREG